MLWNRNDLLRFRFLLWKSFGSDSGFGSGSGFGSDSDCGSGSVPVSEPDFFYLFFNNKKVLPNLASSMLEAELFPRKLASHNLFFYFSITFYVGSWSKSGSGTRTGKQCNSGSAKANSLGSCARIYKTANSKNTHYLAWIDLLLNNPLTFCILI